MYISFIPINPNPELLLKQVLKEICPSNILSKCCFDCQPMQANHFKVQHIKNFVSECTDCFLSLNHKSVGQREDVGSCSQGSYKHYFRRRTTHNFRESLSLSLLTSEGFIQQRWILCFKHPSLNVTRWKKEVGMIHRGSLWHWKLNGIIKGQCLAQGAEVIAY